MASNAIRDHSSLLIILVRLLKQKVCSQLLVLVACKVSLNDLVAGEAESAQSLDGIALFFGDGDGSCAGRKGSCVAHATDSIAAGILGHGVSIEGRN